MAGSCPWTKSNLKLHILTNDFFCLFYLKKARLVIKRIFEYLFFYYDSLTYWYHAVLIKIEKLYGIESLLTFLAIKIKIIHILNFKLANYKYDFEYKSILILNCLFVLLLYIILEIAGIFNVYSYGLLEPFGFYFSIFCYIMDYSHKIYDQWRKNITKYAESEGSTVCWNCDCKFFLA